MTITPGGAQEREGSVVKLENEWERAEKDEWATTPCTALEALLQQCHSLPFRHTSAGLKFLL
jgi:hypothetical protein